MGASEQGAQLTGGRWLVIPRTLSFITNGDAVLLIKRSSQTRIFPNRYNGLGGHIERDEDPLTSARREIEEESGLSVRDLRLRAVYNVDAGDSTGIVLFVFTGRTDNQTVTANAEGVLHWVKRADVFALDLVDDLPLLLPRLWAMRDDDPPIFFHVSYANDGVQLRASNP